MRKLSETEKMVQQGFHIVCLLFLCLIICLKCKSQFKEKLPSLVCVFLSGTADGTRDASLFHIHNGSKFWDGKDSWLNKYKNKDPSQGAAYWGSTTVLAWATDAPHLFNMVNNQFNSFAIALAPQRKQKFGKVILDAIVYNVVRQAGHSLMYDIIIKQQNQKR